jgi:hypothetical protein
VNEGAYLANQNAAGIHGLAAENLYSPALPSRIAAVAGGALSLFMSHGASFLEN